MRIKMMAILTVIILLLTVSASAETTLIRMTCGGDALLGCNEKVREGGYEYSYDRYIDENGYSYPFANLMELFANDDITLLNLEVVLADEPEEKAAKSRFCFRGPTRYAKILSESSVEVVNLANNHIMNHGKAGFDSTVAALDAEGIQYCGSVDGGSYSCIYEVKGIKIGFVGIVPLYYSEGNKAVKDVESKFKELKDADCDLIVASLHCGREYLAKHDDIHIKYEKICLRYGADLIIGTHPHVPQGVRVVNGVTHIFSLGNSSFGGNTGVDENLKVPQSYLASFDLYFEDGVYTGHQMTIWPIYITGSYPVNDYQPRLVTGEEAETVMKMIQKDTAFKLNPYIDGQGAVQEFVPAPVKK